MGRFEWAFPLLFLATVLCRPCSGLSTAENDLQTIYKSFARNGDAYSTFVSLLPVRSSHFERTSSCPQAYAQITGGLLGCISRLQMAW